MSAELDLPPGTHLIVGRGLKVAVSSYAEASDLYARYRGTRPSSQMKDGEIWSRGALVARVSYNARIWPPEEWFPGQEPLYSPYAQEAA